MSSDAVAAATRADRAARDAGALGAGSRCGGFEILRVLGSGGFGIVYLARDPLLNRELAIKEYLPQRLAERSAAGRVVPREGTPPALYADGLRAFLAEARLLARFDHPSLVRVYRFWEDNATAYLAMPRLPGTTLHRARRRSGRVPTPAWTATLVRAMLEALELLHGEGVLHRDVAPDNILLPTVGAPVLLDLGAAHDTRGAEGSPGSPPGVAAVKRGYAPGEQYGGVAAPEQGPWTDLYGLGAVLHFLFRGVAPPPPQEGGFDRHAAPPADVLESDAANLWRLMAWMLEPQPRDRPQSVVEVRQRWPESGTVLLTRGR